MLRTMLRHPMAARSRWSLRRLSTKSDSQAADHVRAVAAHAANPNFVALTKDDIWNSPAVPTLRAADANDYFFSQVNHHDGKFVNWDVFGRVDKKHLVGVVRFGSNLCGAQGMVHGGCIATAFDELFVTATIWTTDHVGFTATMTVDYRRPLFAGNVGVVMVDLTSFDGRKAKLKARMEDAQGQVIAEASTLFVVPTKSEIMDRAKTVATTSVV